MQLLIYVSFKSSWPLKIDQNIGPWLIKCHTTHGDVHADQSITCELSQYFIHFWPLSDRKSQKTREGAELVHRFWSIYETHWDLEQQHWQTKPRPVVGWLRLRPPRMVIDCALEPDVPVFGAHLWIWTGFIITSLINTTVNDCAVLILAVSDCSKDGHKPNLYFEFILVFFMWSKDWIRVIIRL